MGHRATMLGLPPVAPLAGWRVSSRLPSDHYVRLDSNNYSVHPTVIGRYVQVSADLKTVVVICQGSEVARHVRRWADTKPSLTQPTRPPRSRCARLGGSPPEPTPGERSSTGSIGTTGPGCTPPWPISAHQNGNSDIVNHHA